MLLHLPNRRANMHALHAIHSRGASQPTVSDRKQFTRLSIWVGIPYILWLLRDIADTTNIPDDTFSLDCIDANMSPLQMRLNMCWNNANLTRFANNNAMVW